MITENPDLHDECPFIGLKVGDVVGTSLLRYQVTQPPGFGSQARGILVQAFHYRNGWQNVPRQGYETLFKSGQWKMLPREVGR